MNKYELMTIVDSHLTQEQKDTVYKQATDSVVKAGGKVINGQVWLDKFKMTFNIKKCSEATYYLINFEGGSAVNAAIGEILRLNDNVLRFLIIKV